MKNITRICCLSLVVMLFSCMLLEDTVTSERDFENADMREAQYRERRAGWGDRLYEVQFHRLRVDGSFQVELIGAHRDEVLVSAPARLQDNIIVKNNGRELFIHFKKGELIKYKSGDILVRVYARNLTTLKANSGAKITIADTYGADHIDISGDSGGKIFGDFTARKIVMEMESSSEFEGNLSADVATLKAERNGRVSATGRIGELRGIARSYGIIAADRLTAEVADLHADDNSEIIMTISRQAKAKTSSSGNILLRKRGNPSIMKEGNVRNL